MGSDTQDEFDAAWEVHEQLDRCKADIERWRIKVVISQIKLDDLRAEMAGLLSQLSGAVARLAPPVLTR